GRGAASAEVRRPARRHPQPAGLARRSRTRLRRPGVRQLEGRSDRERGDRARAPQQSGAGGGVTETVEQRTDEQEVERREPCLCESFARATERAALAAARWLGRDDA